MFLSEINIYPVKSLKGITLNVAAIEDCGLALDRRWMLVNEQNVCLTQRDIPRMALIKIGVGGDQLTASFNGASLEISIFPAGEEFADVKIWGSEVPARFYNGEINAWFTDVLGRKCRLVLMPGETKRKVEPWQADRTYEDTVSFADGYPFLLIGKASLDDLNSRLEAPLPMNRFRPNLVVTGSEPFAEDTWKKIRIRETIFHVAKPCSRCVVTTIDQSAGEIAGKEPLKTLATYRNKNGKVMFGQNLIAENAGGVIGLNDEVKVMETK